MGFRSSFTGNNKDTNVKSRSCGRMNDQLTAIYTELLLDERRITVEII